MFLGRKCYFLLVYFSKKYGNGYYSLQTLLLIPGQWYIFKCTYFQSENQLISTFPIQSHKVRKTTWIIGYNDVKLYLRADSSKVIPNPNSINVSKTTHFSLFCGHFCMTLLWIHIHFDSYVVFSDFLTINGKCVNCLFSH